jgi:hypothetical protein
VHFFIHFLPGDVLYDPRETCGVRATAVRERLVPDDKIAAVGSNRFRFLGKEEVLLPYPFFRLLMQYN